MAFLVLAHARCHALRREPQRSAAGISSVVLTNGMLAGTRWALRSAAPLCSATPLAPSSHVEAAKDASLVLKPHLKQRMSAARDWGLGACAVEERVKDGRGIKIKGGEWARFCTREVTPRQRECRAAAAAGGSWLGLNAWMTVASTIRRSSAGSCTKSSVQSLESGVLPA